MVEQIKEQNIFEKYKRDIIINLLYGIIILLYYGFLNALEKLVNEDTWFIYVRLSTMVFLILGIIAFEFGYKKDKGKYWIHGIEFVIISFYTLTIRYIVKMQDFGFQKYILTSAVIFLLYYIIKCIIIFKKSKKEYLKSFSDIKEITEKEEPLKKEAKKRNKKGEN